MSARATDPKLPLQSEYCRCSVCGLYFRSASAFDQHRTGPYIEGGRRCLSVEEMQARGMVLNARGYWTRGERTAAVMRRITRHDAIGPEP